MVKLIRHTAGTAANNQEREVSGALVQSRPTQSSGVQSKRIESKRQKLRIGLWDDNSASASRIHSAIVNEHEVIEIAALDALLELQQSEASALDVLVLSIAAMDQLKETLERISEFKSRPLVLGLVAQWDEKYWVHLTRGELDDILVQPVDMRTLSIRLRALGLYSHIAGEWGPTLGVLRNAVLRKESGEIIVRTHEGVARLVMSAGNVAWVHCSWQPLEMRRMLADAGVDEVDTIRAMIEEAQRRGVSLFTVMKAWGIAQTEQLREVLRVEMQCLIAKVLHSRREVAMFVPMRTRSGAISVSLDGAELIRTHAPSSPAAKNNRSAESIKALETAKTFALRVCAQRGVDCVAVVDIEAKSFEWVTGNDERDERIWQLLMLVERPSSSDTVEMREIVVTEGSIGICVWRYATQPFAVYARFEMKDTTVGMLLSHGSRAARDLYRAT